MHFASFVAASLVGVILIDAFSSSHVEAASNLKVMSFNVRTSLANDGCPSGCWDLRRWRVAKLLWGQGPDLLGTQETAPDQFEFIQTQLGLASVGECAGECHGNERNSIFYNSSRLQLLWTKTYALSGTPTTLPSNTWNLEYLRAAVIARFYDVKSNTYICMLNTHYDINRAQEKSSVLVAQLLQQNCQPQDAVFMTGDLNHRPDGPAVKYLLGKATIDNVLTPLPLYETLTAVGQDGATWIGASFAINPIGDKLDYIFARDHPRTCLLSGQILAGFDGEFTSSDHAAVSSEFCLGDGCTNCKS